MKNRAKRALTRLTAAIFILVLFSVVASADDAGRLESINYRLSMSQPSTHLFEVAVEVKLPSGFTSESLDFQMPKWSPGRYAVFDFAKNVQDVNPVAGICPASAQCKLKALEYQRVDDQTWRVSVKGLEGLTFRYRVFGDDLSGTFSQLDARHASFNGGSIFMYVVGHKPDPVSLSITPPSGWRIINGRTDSPTQREWHFDNYDILIDTPTEISPDWTLDEFKVDGKTYKVMVHSFGTEGGKRPALVKDIEKIVRAESAMWGPPEFDSYTFLIHFAADDHSGDGMEHLTSTQIIEPGALGEKGVYEGALETVAHEFFHVWNVKRLRPIELGPWDFTKPANTRGLWVAEGFTNYYGHLMMRRAGIWNDEQFFNQMSQVISGVENAPGSHLMSAIESSLSAPFIDGAESAQRTNLSNTSISYYYKGEVIALVLDSIIRTRTQGRASLDDVMRRMYDEFYLKSPNASYYLKGRGYSVEDVERVVSEVAGTDMHEFFDRYVRGVERLPYEEALAGIGVKLQSSAAPNQWFGGLRLDADESGAINIHSVRPGSPAEVAGLSSGDRLLTAGGERITEANMTAVSSRYKVGDRIPVTFKRDRRELKATIVLEQPQLLKYTLEVEKGTASPTVAAGWKSWLEGKRG
jgi:predicted metalloprotease with PDZ domain